MLRNEYGWTYVFAGVQERSGGERHRSGSSQSYSCCQRGHRSWGLPLLLGHSFSERLGEYVHFSASFCLVDLLSLYCENKNAVSEKWIKCCFLISFQNMKKHSPLFFAATVESFQVVETLSDKAVLIHQTLKVEHFYYNTLTIASWVIIRINIFFFFFFLLLCCRGYGLLPREMCFMYRLSVKFSPPMRMIQTPGWCATSQWIMTAIQ